MARRGIIATRAITPKESLPPFPLAAAPSVKERTKVEVRGPDATPPESKAIPEKRVGQKIIKTMERNGWNQGEFYEKGEKIV